MQADLKAAGQSEPKAVEQMQPDLKALVELDGGFAVAIAIVIDALARKQLVPRDEVLATLRAASEDLEGSYAAKALDLVMARANELGELPLAPSTNSDTATTARLGH